MSANKLVLDITLHIQKREQGYSIEVQNIIVTKAGWLVLYYATGAGHMHGINKQCAAHLVKTLGKYCMVNMMVLA